MKAVIFTSNSIRHKFFANSIAKQFDDALVICECTEHDSKNFENILKLNPLLVCNNK